MSGRICFIERAGDVVAGVRLVGARSEEAWSPPSPSSDEPQESSGLLDGVRSAAAWTVQRCGGTGIGVLCVDVDGSNCSWLNTASMSPQLISAALARTDVAVNGWQVPGPDSASVQALAAPAIKGRPGAAPKPGTESRFAVLTVPDGLARVFIDELDDAGLQVNRVLSLWHAMALAWDPASPLRGHTAGDGIVDAAAPVTGVILVDPAGRIVWCWSSGEQLRAAGVLQLAAGGGDARLGKSEVGRLIADWLSWSMQLGVAPRRIVCVSPSIGEGTPESMQPAQFGSAIGKSWHGATIDMAVHEDPIGATLERLAGWETPSPTGDDARQELVSLSQRPGRAHRSMYVWVSAAIAAGAVGLFGVAVKAMRGASVAKTASVEAQAATRKLVQQEVPPPGNDAIKIAKAEDNPRQYLEEQISAKRESINPNNGLPPTKPILEELDTLSYVLGSGDIEIDEISLQDSTVWVYLYVANTRAGEAIKEGLDAVANDHCEWKSEPPPGGGTKKGDLQPWYLKGSWKNPGGGS